MKKLFIRAISFTLVTVMLTLAFTSCSVSKGYEGAPSGMRPCNEGEHGAIMYVPDYWEVETSTGVPTAFYPDTNDKSSITLTRVPKSELGEMNVVQYWDKYQAEFEASVRDFTLTTTEGSEGAVIKYETMTVAGSSTLYVYKYSFKITGYSGNDIVYCFDQAFVKHPESGDLFIITYSSTKAYYKKHLDDLSKVYANFKFVTEKIPMEDKVEAPSFVKYDGTPEGYGAITSDAISYVLFVPTSWEPTVNTGMTSANSKDDPRVSCSVTTFNLQSVSSYENYLKSLEKDLTDTFGEVTFPDSENKLTPIVVAKHEFRKCTYSVNAYGVPYTYEQYINIDGGVITMLTLACPSEIYPQNTAVFGGIVSNFIYK